MTISLVVVKAFGAYAPGDPITDAATITALWASEAAANVVRVEHPPAPAALDLAPASAAVAQEK